GAVARRRPGVDHLAESRLRGRRVEPAGQRARDPPLAVRRHQPGHRTDRLARLLIPGSSRSEPRSAGRIPAVRPLHRVDGEAARRDPLMPKRTDIKTILIIGAGPIVIGQACEFDYSGAQACKALREEGYRVVLVNSNPATIMTDPEMADAVYIEPINWQTVEKIIAKEKPDALLPTMGGQTALNCALDLADHGVLDKYGVELIGAKREAIRMAEDRELFKQAMADIGLECPRAEVARSYEQAVDIEARVGFPTIIRPSFTLGGSGGGIAYNVEEFEEIVKRGLELS